MILWGGAVWHHTVRLKSVQGKYRKGKAPLRTASAGNDAQRTLLWDSTVPGGLWDACEVQRQEFQYQAGGVNAFFTYTQIHLFL